VVVDGFVAYEGKTDNAILLKQRKMRDTFRVFFSVLKESCDSW
jgi:hypothetical protein